jgi:hypothetical protein
MRNKMSTNPPARTTIEPSQNAASPTTPSVNVATEATKTDETTKAAELIESDDTKSQTLPSDVAIRASRIIEKCGVKTTRSVVKRNGTTLSIKTTTVSSDGNDIEEEEELHHTDASLWSDRQKFLNSSAFTILWGVSALIFATIVSYLAESKKNQNKMKADAAKEYQIASNKYVATAYDVCNETAEDQTKKLFKNDMYDNFMNAQVSIRTSFKDSKIDEMVKNVNKDVDCIFNECARTKAHRLLTGVGKTANAADRSDAGMSEGTDGRDNYCKEANGEGPGSYHCDRQNLWCRQYIRLQTKNNDLIERTLNAVN